MFLHIQAPCDSSFVSFKLREKKTLQTQLNMIMNLHDELADLKADIESSRRKPSAEMLECNGHVFMPEFLHVWCMVLRKLRKMKDTVHKLETAWGPYY